MVEETEDDDWGAVEVSDAQRKRVRAAMKARAKAKAAAQAASVIVVRDTPTVSVTGRWLNVLQALGAKSTHERFKRDNPSLAIQRHAGIAGSSEALALRRVTAGAALVQRGRASDPHDQSFEDLEPIVEKAERVIREAELSLAMLSPAVRIEEQDGELANISCHYLVTKEHGMSLVAEAKQLGVDGRRLLKQEQYQACVSWLCERKNASGQMRAIRLDTQEPPEGELEDLENHPGYDETPMKVRTAAEIALNIMQHGAENVLKKNMPKFKVHESALEIRFPPWAAHPRVAF